MKKILFMSALSLLTVACAPAVTVPPDCAELGGPKSVTIEYGDKGILVVPRRNVKQKSVFIIKLKPTSKEFHDNVVTIDGKAVEPGGDGVKDPDWLDKSDSYNTRKKFVYCTPEVPGEKDQDYIYSVEIEDLGLIDPRVKVER